MRIVPSFAAALALCAIAGTARAADADDDRFLTGALGVIFQVIHEAATSSDPRAGERAMERILSGESLQANRMAAGLIADAMEDLSPEQRVLLLAIGRDLAAIARRDRERAADEAARNPPPGR